MENSNNIIKITVCCAPQLTEVMEDYLMGVLEAAVETGVEDNLLDKTLYAFIEREAASDKELAELVEQVNYYGGEMAAIVGVKAPTVEAAILEDQDWANNWKKYFAPFEITRGVVIKPSWEEYQAREGEAVIEMDPGMAFGTGHHETTSLCMQLIQDSLAEPAGVRVLDVGTGTGILAMAAALFGAENVVGIDNDPDAVSAAAENVAHNNLSDRVDIAITPLAEIGGEYEIVVANIIHDVLVSMRDDLAGCTAQGGTLILSGLLAGEQSESIRQYFEQAGFSCLSKEEQGEWAALRLRKE